MATQDRSPTGDYSIAWTPLGGGNNYVEVDDAPGAPDDDTTYNYRQNSNGQDHFTFSAFSIDSSAVAKLTITIRAMRTAAGATNTKSQVVVGGTLYTGAVMSSQTTWTDHPQDWLTNPDTGSAWIEADIEGTGSNPLQRFGYRSGNLSSGKEVRATQVYATVDYTATGGATFVPKITISQLLNPIPFLLSFFVFGCAKNKKLDRRNFFNPFEWME